MMTISNYFYTGILIIFICASSCIQAKEKIPKSSSKAEKIEELVALYEEYEGFNGSILVAQNGEIIYKNAFGLADMEWDIPNTTDTKYRIASVTKPFTAILILQLVAEGKLDLHKPINTYLPDYPNNNGAQVTIHHLLTHSSGMVRDYESDEKLNKYPDKHFPKEKVSEFSHLPLEFIPGTRFTYSNSGYMVLGYIIESVTGETYETVLQEKILSPLDMKNTGMEKHRPITKHRAKGYFKGFGEYFNSNYIDLSSIIAVGNMYSTVEDLFILDQALYNESLLPNEYLKLIFTEHIADPGYGGYYGYGWEIKEKPIGNTSKTIQTIGHSGSIDGFCALFTRIPTNRASIILLNNTKRAYLNAITTAVTGILMDTSYDFPKKPLAKFMSEVITENGVEEGTLYYREHKDDSDYYIDETELIVAGYKLLHQGHAADAAKVFELSIEVFPDRDNPYDSYAESQMVLGNTSEAIKSYKKSLALNPNNRNAIKMLEKLEK